MVGAGLRASRVGRTGTQPDCERGGADRPGPIPLRRKRSATVRRSVLKLRPDLIVLRRSKEVVALTVNHRVMP